MIVYQAATEASWVDPLVNFLAVLLGAALAWATSIFFEFRAQKAKDLATAYSLMFKLNELCERILRLDQHVRQCLTAAGENGFDGPNWGAILDVIGFGRFPNEISAEELALVARTKDDSLTMKIRELETGHAICFQSFDRIIELKKVLSETGLIKASEGQTVSFEATPEQYANLAPVFVGLQTATNGLIEILPDVTKEARKLASVIGQRLKGHYGFDHFIQMSFPEADTD